jgi:hypothetical protein
MLLALIVSRRASLLKEGALLREARCGVALGSPALLKQWGNCQIKYKLLLIAARSPMLCGERADRNQPDKLPGLSQCEYPAFQTTVGAGPSLRFRGHFAVALRIVRGAILRAADAVSHLFQCALRNLRQFRIAAHLRRTRSWRDRDSRPHPRAPRAALRTLPPQVFFRKTAAPRRAFRGTRAKQVARFVAAAPKQ